MSSDKQAHTDSLSPVVSGGDTSAAIRTESFAPQNSGNPVMKFFAGLPLPAFIYHPQTLQVIKVNPRCSDFYGFTDAELLSRIVIQFHPVNEHADVVAQIALSRTTGTMSIRNWQHIRKDGTVMDVEVWASNIDLDGQPARMAIINNVTEIKRIEAQLRQSNERFELAAKASKDAIYEWNLKTGHLLWTTGLTAQFGYQPEGVDLDFWLGIIHPDDRTEMERSLNDALANPVQQLWSHDYRIRHQQGHWCFVQERCNILRNEAGVVVKGIGVVQDVSEQKRLEQALVKKELERQKIIGQATIDSQEKERAEIGKQLHDNVNQILTTTKLYLDLALSNAELRDGLLEKANRNVIHVINEIRYLSRSLADPSIDDLGLVNSLKTLMADVQKVHGLEVGLQVAGNPDAVLEQGKKLMVFRIVQEALNNIVRHARATKAAVRIEQYDDVFKLAVEDNGIGLEPERLVYGAGLNDIKNRVYLIDGKFQIDAASQKGVTLSISFNI